MTDETFEKAMEVKKDIEFYGNVVADLRYKVARADNKKDKKKFTLRLINYEQKKTANNEIKGQMTFEDYPGVVPESMVN